MDQTIEIQEDRPNASDNDELYDALIAGDWKRANHMLTEYPGLERSRLTKNRDTALHVAARADETKNSLKFVTNLVNMMEVEDLVLKNNKLEDTGIITNEAGNTAFHIACVLGNAKMAEIMMEKNQNLCRISGSDGLFPLSASALAGKYSSVKYLYGIPQNMTDWTADEKKRTLLDCVKSGFFDIAFNIVKDNINLALDVDSILAVLARNPEGFNRAEKNSTEEDTYALKLLKKVWENVQTDQKKTMFKEHGFAAAKAGNTRFVAELLRNNPGLMLNTDDQTRTIFHIAVIHRQRGIYNLLYEIGEYRNKICRYRAEGENNMLHLVGLSSTSSSRFMAAKTSGASLLMQRELLWFKDVYEMMPPSLREEKNNADLTPYELFCQENRERVYEGLQWIKDCMVVATLIITVAFAVAFTIPGGYSQNNGLPVFIQRCDFLVFVIADAFSLFSASISLLVFLSILTSGYEQLDFLFSLPSKLLAGLLSLFISVAAMMVTFSASFFVLYHNRFKWVPILIATFACIPIIVFAMLQFSMLRDMGRSMFDSRYLFNTKKRMLYPRTQRAHSNNSTLEADPVQHHH